MGKRILKWLGRIFITLFVTLVILAGGIYALMCVLVYGPSRKAGELFVMSVRETSAIGFLADWFYTEEEIQTITENNSIKDTSVITDTTLVNVGTMEDTDKMEEEIPEIEVIDIKGATYNGKLMIVKDPSRVFVGTVPQFGDGDGLRVDAMCKNYGAAAGINGGEFVDGDVTSTAKPVGLVISQGKMVYGDLNGNYHVTGFTEDNILVVGNMTGQQALDLGIRDCVNINTNIGPFLIINGELQDVSGVGGGLNPRTAIGQRADGAVLLLVVDGRQANSLGASFSDLMYIMNEYGAVNASTMDGGTSSQMCYNGEIINHPYSPWGARECPTAFLVGGVDKE
ncbi:MAG: phosphodiester glycosidase family protein [Thermoflexaceae bacterium]|nr:phosphodiester glycosidase family protein [Thermoflexaceae bacterium]